jgi:RHS repeat-associated protein
LVDDSGTPTAYYEYDAWGSVLRNDVVSGTGTNRFRYQSNWIELVDSDGELLLSPTRVYDAKIGRFLGRDAKLKLSGGPWFCKNVPVIQVDPSGLADAPVASPKTGKRRDGKKQVKTVIWWPVWAVCRKGKTEYFVGVDGKWWKIIDPNRPHPAARGGKVKWDKARNMKTGQEWLVPIGASAEPDNVTLEGFTQEEIEKLIGPAPQRWWTDWSTGERILAVGGVMVIVGGVVIGHNVTVFMPAWVTVVGLSVAGAGGATMLTGAGTVIVEQLNKDPNARKVGAAGEWEQTIDWSSGFLVLPEPVLNYPIVSEPPFSDQPEEIHDIPAEPIVEDPGLPAIPPFPPNALR